MAKYVSFFTCMLLAVFAYGVYRENQNQQHKELNQILNDARNSLHIIENNQIYPLNYGGEKKHESQKISYREQQLAQ